MDLVVGGGGVTYKHIWGTFDLLVFKVILESFSAFVSRWPVSRNRLAENGERNGVNFFFFFFLGGGGRW